MEDSLRKLGFPVSGTRMGRLIELEVEASDPGEARDQVDSMCHRLLANPLIETYTIELEADGEEAAA